MARKRTQAEKDAAFVKRSRSGKYSKFKVKYRGRSRKGSKLAKHHRKSRPFGPLGPFEKFIFA